MPTHVRRRFLHSRVGSALGRLGRGAATAVVLGLALVGFLHLTRGTAVRHVRGVSSDGRPIAVGEPEFPLMATMATGAWLAPGNRVEVFEWQPSTLHAKTFVADGQWSTVGSMNFDNRSMALNDESTLMILDPAVGGQMDRIFLDDLRHAEEITLAKFQQRSWWARLTERAANGVMRLL